MNRYHSRRPDYQARPTGPAVWIVLFVADVLAVSAAIGALIAVMARMR